MVWANLDDGFSDHPKNWALSDAAYRLHVSGINYCGRLLTDGVIPLSIVPRLKPGYRPSTLKELLAAGVWHPDGHDCSSSLCVQPGEGSVYVHDFLATNRPRAQVLAERAANAERQKRWRDKQRERQRDKHASHTTTNRASNGVSNDTRAEPSPPPSEERAGEASPTDPRRCADDTCDDGWLPDPDKPGNVLPCPTCRPYLATPRRTA